MPKGSISLTLKKNLVMSKLLFRLGIYLYFQKSQDPGHHVVFLSYF